LVKARAKARGCARAQIIPVENIQGRKAVESGDTCLRKTAAGVDLNRNWAPAGRQARPRAACPLPRMLPYAWERSTHWEELAATQ